MNNKTSDDTTYFCHRLTVELDRAREADKIEVKLIHLAMAAGYRAKLHNTDEETPILRQSIRA